MATFCDAFLAGRSCEKRSPLISALAGSAVVNMGSAALAFLMVATPFGWVALIVGGVAVAGVAAAASIGMNSYTKENSGGIYDAIMNGINSQ